MNERKIERVSKAICQAAGRYFNPQSPCPQCYNTETKKEECNMWNTFRSEAIAAINAIKGF
jgi:hypothetical protein